MWGEIILRDSLILYYVAIIKAFLPRSEELHECTLSGMTFSKTK